MYQIWQHIQKPIQTVPTCNGHQKVAKTYNLRWQNFNINCIYELIDIFQFQLHVPKATKQSVYATILQS